MMWIHSTVWRWLLSDSAWTLGSRTTYKQEKEKSWISVTSFPTTGPSKVECHKVTYGDSLKLNSPFTEIDRGKSRFQLRNRLCFKRERKKIWGGSIHGVKPFLFNIGPIIFFFFNQSGTPLIYLKQKSPLSYTLWISSTFNKHWQPIRRVGYFALRSRLLFPLNWSN